MTDIMTIVQARAAEALEIMDTTEAAAAATTEEMTITTAVDPWEDPLMGTAGDLRGHRMTAVADLGAAEVDPVNLMGAAQIAEGDTGIQDLQGAEEETTATDRGHRRGITEATVHHRHHPVCLEVDATGEEAVPAEAAPMFGHLHLAEEEVVEAELPLCQQQSGVAMDHPESRGHQFSADPTLAEGCPWYNPSGMVEAFPVAHSEEDLLEVVPGEIGLMRIRILWEEEEAGQRDIEKETNFSLFFH